MTQQKRESNAKQLTGHQIQLKNELREIGSLLQIDYDNIAEYDPEERTPRLKLMMNQLIRSEVIVKYVLIDEELSVAICHYFFGKKRGFIRLWRAKKFRNFNYYVIEVLSLNEKFRLVKAIARVPG